jgi:type II secretion system protein C
MNYSRKYGFFLIFFLCVEILFVIPNSSNQSPRLSLIGVVVSENTSSSVAILKNEETGRVIFLGIGEKISDLILTDVFKNRVVLKGDEKSIEIFIGGNNSSNKEGITKKKPQISNRPQTREFSRSETLKRVLIEWPLIMKEIRFVPNYIDGKICGFKINKIPEESILSEIGINKNDVIREINGVELDSMEALFFLFNKIRNQNRLEISIERDGEPINLVYILKNSSIP